MRHRSGPLDDDATLMLLAMASGYSIDDRKGWLDPRAQRRFDLPALVPQPPDEAGCFRSRAVQRLLRVDELVQVVGDDRLRGAPRGCMPSELGPRS